MNFVSEPLAYDLSEICPEEDMMEMAKICEELRKELFHPLQNQKNSYKLIIVFICGHFMTQKLQIPSYTSSNFVIYKSSAEMR